MRTLAYLLTIVLLEKITTKMLAFKFELFFELFSIENHNIFLHKF